MHKDNYTPIALMGEGYSPGSPPSVADLRTWADDGATFPIVADPDYVYVKKYWNGANALGVSILLRPGLEVMADNPDLDSVGDLIQ